MIIKKEKKTIYNFIKIFLTIIITITSNNIYNKTSISYNKTTINPSSSQLSSPDGYQSSLPASLMSIGDKIHFTTQDNFTNLKDLGEIKQNETKDTKFKIPVYINPGKTNLSNDEYYGYKFSLEKYKSLGEIWVMLINTKTQKGRISKHVFKIYRKEAKEDKWVELGEISNKNSNEENITKENTIDIKIDGDGNAHILNGNITINLIENFDNKK